jgi:ADP-ribosylation factor family
VEFDCWDLGGKLPHLWAHHFLGTQGVFYIIDEHETLSKELVM